MMSPPLLILASHSTGRAELLRAAGYDFVQWPSNAEEPRREPGEPVAGYVARLALRKARAVAAREPGAVVLAADTVLWMDGETIGKPQDEDHAVDMLLRLGGRTHEVVSGVAVLAPGLAEPLSGADAARVALRRWDRAQILAYIHRAQPLRFAGAYALQGEGAAMVERLDGDPSTVIGMPLSMVMDYLARAGAHPAKSP